MERSNSSGNARKKSSAAYTAFSNPVFEAEADGVDSDDGQVGPEEDTVAPLPNIPHDYGSHGVHWNETASSATRVDRTFLTLRSIPLGDIPDLINGGSSRNASHHDLQALDASGTTSASFAPQSAAEEEFLELDRDQTIAAVTKQSMARHTSFIDVVSQTPNHHHSTHRAHDVNVPHHDVDDVENNNNTPQRSNSVNVPLEVQRRVYNQRAFDLEFEWEPRQEYQEYKESLRDTCCITWRQLITKLIGVFPILTWLPKYSLRNYLVTDLIAGITVGVMNIPQGMAYATLANVPPVNGLYSTFITSITYMIFGTSSQVSFGTWSVLSLLVGEVVLTHPLYVQLQKDFDVLAINDTDIQRTMKDELSVEISQSLTMLIGIFLLIMGICRIGFITAYLSDQVIAGFTTGAGFTTATSQLSAISGLYLTKKAGPWSIFEIYIDFFSKIPQINWWAMLVTFITGAFLFIGKTYISPITERHCRVPVPWYLFVVVIGTGVSYGLDLEHSAHLAVIGNIPLGIQVGVPNLSSDMIGPMITDAIAISFVVYVVTVSIGKLFAKRFHYTIDIAQEPYAFGVSNIASSFFMGVACCASLTRSTVLGDVKACTPLHNLFTAILILLVLLVIATLFYSLPKAVLGAIIIVALKNVMMQFTQLPRLWRVSKYDFVSQWALWVISFTATVVLGVQLGLIFSILCALFTAIVRTQWPPAVLEGQLPGTDIYYNKLKYKKAISIPNVIVFRYDAALMFTNSERFRITLYDRCGIDLSETRHEIALIDTPAAALPLVIPPTATKAEVKEAKKEAKKEKKAKTKTEVIRKKGQLDPSQVPTERDRKLQQIRRRLNLPDVVVLDCSGFNYIDIMGVNVLTEVYGELSEMGILLLYAVMKAQARDMLDAAHFFDKVSKTNVFPTVHDAVTFGLYKVERDRLFEETASAVKVV